MMLLAGLIFIATALTATMFATRQSMLGFACALFWVLTGAQAYTLSLTPWDVYFATAFACLLGMVFFCIYGAYGLREKRDTIADEEFEKGEGEFIGEGSREPDMLYDEDKPKSSARSQKIRDRAERRRSKSARKGEFGW